ncbi:MAG: citramalate synthase, partial [Desulfobacterales bacterium]
MTQPILVYDTTLRDGTQGEQVTLSAEDKLRIARKLDDFGVHYIEGGWPGANPKDIRFFKEARKIAFKTAKLAAFGSTRKANTSAEKSQNILALLEAETTTVAIVGKSWDLHTTQILGVSPDENLKMIEETLAYLKKKDREVIYDAEHFFDGYRENPEYALKTIQAALAGGADLIVLCDTNGASMPDEIENSIQEILPQIPVPMGIHCHNDCGLALANSLSAVKAGAKMVQGTVNGYGERCGNLDLILAIANLQLKMGHHCVDPKKIKQLTELSRYVSEVANVPPFKQRPF